MFRIVADEARKLIRVEVSGLGTLAEVTHFNLELEMRLNELAWRSGEYVILMHMLDQIVQTQAVMKAFSEGLESFPLPARKLAVVKGGALASLQARRVLDGEQAALFATADEAERWLET